ncbi:unnamed protein product [Strongylus vulgaris]|uniref:SH3 domain-containing protein n=1 Tax=Strongylus vulgaris TaxID=40348 RepID=A0A3P7LLD5_STRVU|nr:unnamed protein product [Strongylus vulgaris]
MQGELVTFRREIDENWLEGTNYLGEIGIFPRAYVVQLDDNRQIDETTGTSPDRPKTPKTFENVQPHGVSKSNSCGALHQSPASSQQTPNHVDNQLLACASSERSGFGTLFFRKITTGTSPDRPKTPKTFENVQPHGVSKSSSESRRLSGCSSMSLNKRFSSSAHANSVQKFYGEGVLTRGQNLLGKTQVTVILKLKESCIRHYRALYRYVPAKDDEIALEVDDIVFVVEKCDDGWFIECLGTVLRTGQFGTFPGNYVVRH